MTAWLEVETTTGAKLLLRISMIESVQMLENESAVTMASGATYTVMLGKDDVERLMSEIRPGT